MRFRLFRTQVGGYRWVWSFSHILLDGWAAQIIIRQAFRQYDRLCGGRAMEKVAHRPFSDFISWLQQRDLSAAKSFWKEHGVYFGVFGGNVQEDVSSDPCTRERGCSQTVGGFVFDDARRESDYGRDGCGKVLLFGRDVRSRVHAGACFGELPGAVHQRGFVADPDGRIRLRTFLRPDGEYEVGLVFFVWNCAYFS